MSLVVRCRFFLLLGFWLSASAVVAQGTKDDYLRAETIKQWRRGHVFRDRIDPQWLGDGSFWYRISTGVDKHEFVHVEPTKKKRAVAFDHARLAMQLSKLWKREVAPDSLPLDDLSWSADGLTLYFSAQDKRYACQLKDYAMEERDKASAGKDEAEKEPNDGRRKRRGRGADSPDGKWTAAIEEHNVYLHPKEEKEPRQLSSDGDERNSYESRFYWSPDSSKLVVIRTEKGQEHKVHLIESSPKDQLQPKLISFQYLKPGDKIPHSRPALFDIASGEKIEIDAALFPNPWSISEVRWSEDSSRFMFLYNQRGHQVLRVISVDAETGETGTVIDEVSETFIDYAYKKYSRYEDKTNEIIWMSERDGWNHLYLIDSLTGNVKNQITQGQWVVRGVEHVDSDTRRIWFRASGVYPEQDPYYTHVCRVNFDGSEFVVLTAGNGTHEASFSPDRKYLIDRFSRVDKPPRHVLRDGETGKRLALLEDADMEALKTAGWRAPQRFKAKGRDGRTDIYGIIVRPANFDPQKKYPVIEKIYAGPHGSFTPKSFQPYLDMMSMAELGFIVVQLDGMGTSNRSKAFHNVAWKNLGDSGFPDRILWIQAAAKREPAMDITRVGIYGGSAGGQSSTRALLAHGDFYRVAVSDCGCHDNRMDKIWWNELWMGWPLGPHYEAQSNVTHAKALQGDLLLIVGELDRNVDPASTMQLVNALIKEDKDFEMLVVPGGGHGIGGAYGVRRRRDFFVRKLLQVEPRGR